MSASARAMAIYACERCGAVQFCALQFVFVVGGVAFLIFFSLFFFVVTVDFAFFCTLFFFLFFISQPYRFSFEQLSQKNKQQQQLSSSRCVSIGEAVFSFSVDV